MQSLPTSKLLTFIRHAPSEPKGFLFGRYDADISDISPGVMSSLRTQISSDSLIVCSPAKRCQKTCDAILSANHPRETYDNLWEQSFGIWDGIAFSEVPDVGALTDEALVDFKPPDGESFIDLCKRVQPVIEQICLNQNAEKVTFFVHAGVIRAALALAFGNHIAALKCEIDTLSITNLRYLGGQSFSVVFVNKRSVA